MADENQDAQKQSGVKMLATDTRTSEAKSPDAAQAEVRAGKVDGKVVSEEEYRKAAGENGYDLARMPPNYFPDINTQK